jgi:hypothetical protein
MAGTTYCWNTHNTFAESYGLSSYTMILSRGKAVPLHAMEALGGRGGIAPTHSRPRH